MEVLLLTDGLPVGVSTADVLRRRGVPVRLVREPTDRDVARELKSQFSAVAVLARDDIVALRLALVVEHFAPGVPMVVTVFDRTVAGELRRSVPGCSVISPADIAAPSLADACLEGRPAGRPPLAVRLFDQVIGALNPAYAGARILIAGLLGLLLVFTLDAVLLATVLGIGSVDAIYGAASTLTTVGAEPTITSGPQWLKLISAANMLLTVAFAAMFTAGLVQRLLDPRLATIVGRRSIPRRGHVIVIGLGQVGLRLCTLLTRMNIPVVGVEVDPDAPNVRLARGYGIPVVIGHGEDRGILERLSAQRALALASVTSNELVNVEIAVAARAAQEALPVVLTSRHPRHNMTTA
ncbi:MAG: NAD-binding protein [Solirubrobacterales bacterium]|nr:NAD-binding protein [Solirubrobacterales bacterium]